MSLLDDYDEILNGNSASRPAVWEETLVIDTDLAGFWHRTQKPIYIGGTLYNVYREINFKHCECVAGGKHQHCWTGDASTECHAHWFEFERLEMTPEYAIFKCPVSGYNIVLLRSTKEEIKNCGYFRTLVVSGDWPKVECSHKLPDGSYSLQVEDGNFVCSLCKKKWYPGKEED